MYSYISENNLGTSNQIIVPTGYHHTCETHKYHKHILCWQITVMFLLYQPGESVYCQMLNSNTSNPHLYLRLAASQYLSNVFYFNTLRTGEADLRFYVTTVQDG